MSSLRLAFLFWKTGYWAASREACLFHAPGFILIPPVLQSGEAEAPKTPQPLNGNSGLVIPNPRSCQPCVASPVRVLPASPPGNPKTALTARKRLGLNRGLRPVGPPSATWGHAGHLSPPLPAGHWKGEERLTGWKDSCGSREPLPGSKALGFTVIALPRTRGK